MRAVDFWEEKEVPDPWGGEPTMGEALKEGLFAEIRKGPIADASDLDVAYALVALVWAEFEGYGTNGRTRLTDVQIRAPVRALVAALKRLSVDFEPPFQDFETFFSFWVQHGARGSWQARRDILNDLFRPIRDELEVREDLELEGELADPVAERPTGWPAVDAEILEMRRHFRSARSEADYRNVGNDCVTILERLSGAAYDPSRHLRDGEDMPPVARTKQRIGRVLEDGLPDSSEVRRLATAVIELAQATKHNPTSDRLRAGIAADAVIQLVNMVRRAAGPGPAA